MLVDSREARLGEKLTDFEISGYPIAIVVGQKEMDEGVCTIISRITGEKIQARLEEAAAIVDDLSAR